MDKITKEFLESQIVDVKYTLIGETLTHCAITVKNGFVFTGESACVNPANFDKEIGEKMAYENAFNSMWLPYGFWLKQKNGGDFAYRLRNERDELAERVEKLGAFIQSEAFSDLPSNAQKDLKIQYETMQPYLNVLNKRIAAL